MDTIHRGWHQLLLGQKMWLGSREGLLDGREGLLGGREGLLGEWHQLLRVTELGLGS